MAKCETAADRDAAAADWTARIDRGPLLPQEERDLQSWLSVDSRRLGALARAQAIYARADRIQVSDTPPVSASTPARRSWKQFGAIAAALAIVTIAAVIGLHSPQTTTRRGEVRLVPMPDGSAIVLNTASRISTDFNEAERHIQLIEGEALFNVAKDASRPFIVEAAGTRVRAVGTSFSVRRMPDDSVQVLVREGVVEVTHQAAKADPAPVRAVANTKVIARDVMKTQTLADAEVARELVWREGVISLDGVSLQQAADEFARYSDMRITFETTAIANRKVTGLFAANDPVGFARAVALSMNLSADVDPTSERIFLRD